MAQNNIRLLTADDIEVRIGQTSDKTAEVKVTLLLYKNARVDMAILDEIYGPFGWRRTHRLMGDRLYCAVDVWDDAKQEWISKEDVGVESNTEPEKGQASDSFKRACVNWGIGRELYTAPRISIKLNPSEYQRDTNGRVRVWTTFDVADIAYDEAQRRITALRIVDRDGVTRYEMGKPQSTASKPAAQSTPAPVQETKTAPTKPASTPKPASTVSILSKQNYDRWVEAAARKVITANNIEAGKDFIRIYNPTAKELKAFNDAVFAYCVDHPTLLNN